MKKVPVLRFPGFEGAWEETCVKDLTESSAFGPRFSSEKYSDTGNVATLRTTDMDDEGNLSLDKMPLADIDVNSMENHILQKDDLVISRSGTIGITAVFQGYKIPVLPGAFLIRFRLNKSYVIPSILSSYFNSRKGRNILENLSGGGVQKNLTSTAILEVKLHLPTLPEQQKIAAFLTAVDTRIQQLTRKKVLLEQYKKGVMQKLFSRELRFKDADGKEFPEWEVKQFGEITLWASGGTPSKENERFWNGEIPWISASSMRGVEYFDSEKKLTKDGLVNGSRLAKKGSILMLVRGSMLFNTIPVGIAQRDLAFNQDVKSIYVKEGNSNRFILQWIIGNENKLLNMVTGTGIGAGKLDLIDLKNLNLPLPSLPEQQKIAAFLTALDDKINRVGGQIGRMQAWKKGLLQRMFV